MAETVQAAKIHVPAGASAAYWMAGGEMATIMLSSDDTHGAYAVVEVTIPPTVGPPPHIHHAMEETFYLVNGEMEFVIDGATLTATAGSLVRIPRGALRGYRAMGSESAKVIMLFLPGGFEGFLKEMGQPVTDSSPPEETPLDVQTFVATAAKYGCEIPPPAGHP